MFGLDDKIAAFSDGTTLLVVLAVAVVLGLGHATSLFAFGVPVVLYSAYLPEPVQSAAETAVGFVIVALAVLLLVRWRRGMYRDDRHSHRPLRNVKQAYAIGVVHGMGG